MNPKEYREAIRQMLAHENNLVNNRYTWMLATQSLLFGALGVFWDKDIVVELVICSVGLCSTCSVFYALYLANRSIWNLVKDWESYCESNKDACELPPIYGLRWEWPQWPCPWLFVPPVVIVAWLVILIRRLPICLFICQ